jgi:alkanesulfonate monooxygenase SsuD/methylene tetrahydromethanopterin reductase-like flavin-dependent oxidoreductase (luciferase family)
MMGRDDRYAAAQLLKFADALFCSSLTQADRPTCAQIRKAVKASFARFGSHHRIMAHVGAIACSHPEAARKRLAWCREAVAEAYDINVGGGSA